MRRVRVSRRCTRPQRSPLGVPSGAALRCLALSVAVRALRSCAWSACWGFINQCAHGAVARSGIWTASSLDVPPHNRARQPVLAMLRVVVMQGCSTTIPLLIKAGCSTSDVDDEGYTPVERALVSKRVECSYALYCAGAIFTKRQLLLLGILLRESTLLRCGASAACSCYHCALDHSCSCRCSIRHPQRGLAGASVALSGCMHECLVSWAAAGSNTCRRELRACMQGAEARQQGKRGRSGSTAHAERPAATAVAGLQP